MAASRRLVPATPPLAETPNLLRRPRGGFTPDLRDLLCGFSVDPLLSAPQTPALRDLYQAQLPVSSPTLSASVNLDAFARHVPSLGGSDDDAAGAAGGGAAAAAADADMTDATAASSPLSRVDPSPAENKDADADAEASPDSGKEDDEGNGVSVASANAAGVDLAKSEETADASDGMASGFDSMTTPVLDTPGGGASGPALSRAGHVAAMSSLFYPGLPVDATLAGLGGQAGLLAQPLPSATAAGLLPLGSLPPQVPPVMRPITGPGPTPPIPAATPSTLQSAAVVAEALQNSNAFHAAFQVHQQQQMAQLHQLYQAQAQSMFLLNGGHFPLAPLIPFGAAAEFGGTSLTSSPDITYGTAAGLPPNHVVLDMANSGKLQMGGLPKLAVDLAKKSPSPASAPTTPRNSDGDDENSETSSAVRDDLNRKNAFPGMADAVVPSGTESVTNMEFSPAPGTAGLGKDRKSGSRPSRSSKERRQLAVERAGCSAEEAKANRAAAIERLRAKKQLRTFRFKVRYACRKKIAMVRPRINGRFATKEEVAEAKRLGIPLP